MVESNYKLEFILGLVKGNYFQMTLNMKDELVGKTNFWLAIFSIAYLIIPATYLLKILLQGERKGNGRKDR